MAPTRALHFTSLRNHSLADVDRSFDVDASTDFDAADVEGVEIRIRRQSGGGGKADDTSSTTGGDGGGGRSGGVADAADDGDGATSASGITGASIGELGLMDACMVTDIDTDYETDFGHQPRVFAEARMAHEVIRGEMRWR